MDELDMKILKALRYDARKPFLELAKELGVGDATIHARVKKMIDEGVIKGFETMLDYEKMGYAITAFVEINVEPGTADQATKKLRKIEGVLEVYEIHGHWDILLKVRAKSLSELRDKLDKEIRSIGEVVDSQANTVLRIVKEDRALPIAMLQ